MHDVPEFDLYGSLGVLTTATIDEIEMAFRAEAKRHHPDTSAEPAGATGRMQRLNVARDWLTDPELRRRYDQVRGVGRSSATIPVIDPLGAWPDTHPSPSVDAAPSSFMPAMAAIALMVLLGTVVVGIGTSILTVAAFALAIVLFLFAGLVTVLGWLR